MNQSKVLSILEFWTSGGNWLIEIPKFQRPYCWDKKLIITLFTDILSLSSDGNTEEKKFFGSIYLKKEKDKDCDISRIIDGQQRLITTFIMLVVIKNEYKEIFSKNDLRIRNPNDNASRIKILTEINDDQVELLNLCNNIARVNKKSKIFKAYKIISDFFKENVKGYSNEDKEFFFKDWFRKLSNCEIVINELDDRNDMYQVFHSINSKAKRLELLDILNNYLLKFANVNKEIEEIWKCIVNKYKEINEMSKFQYLFRYFLQYKLEYDIKINDLIFAFTNHYNNGDNILNFVKEFNEFIAFCVEKLRYWEYSIFLKDKQILLGQLFFIHKKVDQNFSDLFMKILLSWLFRRNVCDLDTKGITAIIPTVVRDILNYKANSLEEKIKQYFINQNGKNSQFPNDDIFTEKLINEKIYTKKNICKPLLIYIDAKFYHRPPIDILSYVFDNIQVEHVISQSTPNDLGDDLTPEEKNKLIHSLGNLTILDGITNRSISNLTFAQKKEFFSGSTFKINKYFDNIQIFKSEDIKNRARSLIDFIIRTFPSFSN